MNSLPDHGRIQCHSCFKNGQTVFDQTCREEGDWRITSNPLAWGNSSAEIVVLGFSKGPTQAGALASTPHDEIAYKGSRLNVGKILSHVGLISPAEPDALKKTVDRLIADPNGRFHFGSLIRCTVEQFDRKLGKWKGSGGGMLDRFVASTLGGEVSQQCVKKYLADLPSTTKLIVMFGLGTKQNYVRSAFHLFKIARPGNWKWLNEVTYTDGVVTIVHVEHFAAQGALIPNWLGANEHPRSALGLQARDGVAFALEKIA